MPALTYPGPASPRLPRVTVVLPDDWAPVPPGGDLLRARGSGRSGEPVEVEVRHHTGPAEVAPADLLERTATPPPAASGAEVEEPFVVDLGGREWHGRNVSWDDPVGPVVEVHLATRVGGETDDEAPDGDDGAAPSRLVHAVGRVRGPSVAEDYDALQGVLETLVVEEDAG